MSKLPVATPDTEGRTFGNDWSIANVATLLRSNAQRGVYRLSSTGGTMAKVNQHYLRTVSARHLPTNVSLIFMRLEDGKSWYASLCFMSDDDDGTWNDEVAEQWLSALFGADRLRVREEVAPDSRENLRQFTLS
jgi:hypothetical protein